MDWVLYGAAGTTGRLITEVAVRRGHRPILAGRSAGPLRSLAERHGLAWQVVDLEDAHRLQQLVGSAPLSVLAGGPFHTASLRVAQACLASGAHYLDLANEVPVLEAIYGLDDVARARGVTLLPAVGFGAVAADSLARHVADLLPTANTMDLTIDLYTAGTSPGARANALRVLADGGQLRRDGQLTRVRLGSSTSGAIVPSGARAVITIPSGELSAVSRTTGIANVSVSRPVALPALLARVLLPALPLIASSQAVQRYAARRPPTELPSADPQRRSRIWARANDADGQTATTLLETTEGYAFSAESAVAAAEAVLSAPVPGAHSPGALLGPDFALRIPGTRRIDMRVGAEV
jgi:short subunit dehydrogenase-like uncharacterized protein